MVSNLRRFSPNLALGLLVGFVAACGGDKPPEGDDGGTGPRICSSDTECLSNEFCDQGACERKCSSNADCSSGTCELATGRCVSGGGPDGGGGTPDGGGGGNPDGGGGNPDGGGGGNNGTPCATKYDCADGLICKGNPKTCQDPRADNGCSADLDCPRGEICNFSKQCEPGCSSGRDCDAPKLCHPQKFVCEACSLANPCPAGNSCIGGACVPATNCSNNTECNNAATGSVCKAGKCTNCGSHSDCRDAPYGGSASNPYLCSANGICEIVTCSDSSCQQQLGSLGYCDTVDNTCKTRGCLSNADCQAPQVCDSVNQTCTVPPENCDTAACDADCGSRIDPLTGAAQTCNYASCTCSGGGGSGAEGDPCITSAECGSGLTCGLGICTAGAVQSDGSACDAATCTIGGLFGSPCVSSVDPSYVCDPTGCLFSLLFGGTGPAPCL